MSDPVTTVATVVGAVPPLVQASRFALRKLRQHGTIEIQWLQLGDDATLPVDAVEDLERFLDSRETRALLSVLASTLIMPKSKQRETALSQVRTFFMDSAQRTALPR